MSAPDQGRAAERAAFAHGMRSGLALAHSVTPPGEWLAAIASRTDAFYPLQRADAPASLPRHLRPVTQEWMAGGTTR